MASETCDPTKVTENRVRFAAGACSMLSPSHFKNCSAATPLAFALQGHFATLVIRPRRRTFTNVMTHITCSVQEEKAMSAAPSMPIDVARFVTYVQERRKKRILYKGEFLVISCIYSF
jgi:hypothetical protein